MSDPTSRQSVFVEATDPDVLDLTDRVLLRSRAYEKPDIDIKCAKCGTDLAGVGRVDGFVLFSSCWEAPLQQPWTVIHDGAHLAPHRAIEYAERRRLSGPSPLEEFNDGTFAVLNLPAELPQDYPDLLVRDRHGSRVLDRHRVLGWLQSGGRAKYVKLETPHPRIFPDPADRYAFPRSAVEQPTRTTTYRV